MTIHKAKGLEFDCVFLYSCIDSKIPGVNRKPTLTLPKNYSNDLSRDAHLLEAKRLLFVALTRARFLFICTSADNYDGKKAKPCRWISDITSKSFVAPLDSPANTNFTKASECDTNSIVEKNCSLLTKKSKNSTQLIVDSPSKVSNDNVVKRDVDPNRISVPLVASDGAVNLSYSKMSTYDKCPKQFHYNYVLVYIYIYLTF